MTYTAVHPPYFLHDCTFGSAYRGCRCNPRLWMSTTDGSGGQGLSRDYWLLWSGSALSNLGDGVRLTAFPLLAAAFSRDPVAVGGVTAASFVPWMLFALPGGTLVDRFDRRRLIVWGQVARGVAVAIFAGLLAAGAGSLAALYVVAVLVGTGEVLVDSATQAVIPHLASTDQLELANSRLIAGEILTNEVTGGPLGGWLFLLAAAAPFAFDAATFLVGALLIAAIRRPLQIAERPQSTFGSDVVEGLRYLWHHPILRGLAWSLAVINLALTAATSLLVLLALDQLGLSASGFGILIGVGAVGGIVGSLLAQRLVKRFGRRTILITGIALSAPGFLLVGLAGNEIVAGVGVVLGGATVAMFNVVGRSLRQAITPDRLLGRVVASFRLFGYSAIPIGALVGGAVARVTSVRTTYVLSALVLAAATIAISRVVTNARLEQA